VKQPGSHLSLELPGHHTFQPLVAPGLRPATSSAVGCRSVAQAIPVGIERILAGVAVVDRDLRHGARPGLRQLARGLGVAKQVSVMPAPGSRRSRPRRRWRRKCSNHRRSTSPGLRRSRIRRPGARWSRRPRCRTRPATRWSILRTGCRCCPRSCPRARLKKILSAMGLPPQAPKLWPARPPPSESGGEGGGWLN